MSVLLIVNEKDNVAIALCDLKPGEVVDLPGSSAGTAHGGIADGVGAGAAAGAAAGIAGGQVRVSEAIPFGHKVALCDIPAGAPVVKYGEIIGIAAMSIRAGEHVHTRNLRAQRGRGE